MKQECAVSLARFAPRRIATPALHSTHARMCAYMSVRIFSPGFPPSIPSSFSVGRARYSHRVSLPDDSDPTRHKRVINYLRVGHVFPSCSLSFSFRSSLAPFFLSLQLPLTVSPAAFHLAPPTLRVCTHSLMLIRLNAQKPSRGRDERLASPRLASPKNYRRSRRGRAHGDQGGHGRSRGK